MCNFPCSNFKKVRLGPLRRCRLQWGQSAAARTDLGNYTVGKLPLGKNPLEKFLTSFIHDAYLFSKSANSIFKILMDYSFL